MVVLILFAFLAGVVTILSPCILPVLPILLSSSVDSSGKWRPFGVVAGFVLSFTFFTLFLSTIVRLSGISADALRVFSIVLLIGFGLSLLVPQLQLIIEQLWGHIASFAPKQGKRTGFLGGALIGFSLGLLWTPCVGPILASVITLALTGTVTIQAVAITFSYSLGTAIPMFMIIHAGSSALQKVPWLTRRTRMIQKGFGVVMIFTAVMILLNVDRSFQTFVLKTFPQYGSGLTAFEDTTAIRTQLSLGNPSAVDSQLIGKPMPKAESPKGPKAPELIPGGEWFNSQPLTLADLRGKVVLIDFWTYSCINCQRTLPYLRSWHEKYKNKGLVIIGVHAPEFEFEKEQKNVSRAIADFGLTYPVVQDNNFQTWRAYDNHYWPAKYFIDKDGYIRYSHFGEGAYDESEKMIQVLLEETGSLVSDTKIENPEYSVYAKTPESYLGYKRIEYLISPERVVPDTQSVYTAPAVLPKNKFAFDGAWTVMSEYATPTKGANLSFHIDAQDVYLVARPTTGVGKIRVFVDDVMQFFGEDSHQGVVTVDSDRLYKIIHFPTAAAHTIRLEFEDGNDQLYAFTFG